MQCFYSFLFLVITQLLFSQDSTSQILFEGKIYSSEKKISGIVLDGNSYEPMPFVSVSIRGKNKFTQTDIDGIFTISATINDTLFINSAGFIAQNYSITENEIVLLLLEDRKIRLEPPHIPNMGKKVIYSGETFSKREIRKRQKRNNRKLVSFVFVV